MANMANTAAYKLPDGRLAVNVDSAKILAAEDSGYVQNVISDAAATIVTIPATAVVGIWTIRNGGAPQTGTPAGAVDDGHAVVIDPSDDDTLAGLDVEGDEANGMKLTNTAATARYGDEITIINTGATDGGLIHAVKGTWERETE